MILAKTDSSTNFMKQYKSELQQNHLTHIVLPAAPNSIWPVVFNAVCIFIIKAVLRMQPNIQGSIGLNTR